MSTDENYLGVLLEEIRDQNKAVLESVSSLQTKVGLLATKQDLERVETKVDTIQVAVKDTNQDLSLLDQRVTKFEQAA